MKGIKALGYTTLLILTMIALVASAYILYIALAAGFAMGVYMLIKAILDKKEQKWKSSRSARSYSR